MISIIIPVLNEANGLTQHLQALQPFRAAGHELIVVDGGSQDQSAALAKPLCDQVLCTSKGRAIQMNLGAQQAKGTLLLFHHCDSTLPEEALLLLTPLINSVCWGRFDVELSETTGLLGLVGTMMSLRSRWTGIATGDQSMFVSKALFQQIGGFPNQPLMEDIALSASLKKRQPPICFTAKVITSARRWQKNGVLRTIVLMWCLRLSYFLGVRPETLVKIYYPNHASKTK